MFNECQDARQNLVRSLYSTPFLLGSGCERPDLCRTSQVRQIRSYRRILDGLASASGSERIRQLQKLLPRVPRKSIFCTYVDGVAFWSAINSLTNEMASLSPAQARGLLGRRATLVARHSLSHSFSLLGKSLHGPCSCYSE